MAQTPAPGPVPSQHCSTIGGGALPAGTAAGRFPPEPGGDWSGALPDVAGEGVR